MNFGEGKDKGFFDSASICRNEVMPKFTHSEMLFSESLSTHDTSQTDPASSAG
jgi:hypothetical protein